MYASLLERVGGKVLGVMCGRGVWVKMKGKVWKMIVRLTKAKLEVAEVKMWRLFLDRQGWTSSEVNRSEARLVLDVSEIKAGMFRHV